jgi:hypothetical protein
MHARKLIDGAAFGPDALKAIGEAFDAAWAEIEGNFGNVPIDNDNARFGSLARSYRSPAKIAATRES